MSGTNKANRVLIRRGARLLTKEEWQQVPGGITTHICTINRTTCTSDSDCPVPIGCPPA